MSVPVIKAITRRIRLRYGSTVLAAQAAGCSPGVWSHYENDEHPDKTIPIPRFLMVANGSERAALAALILSDGEIPPGCAMEDSSETTEAAADLQRAVREAMRDGKVSTLEARTIVRKAMSVKANARDVIAAVQGAA